MDRKRILLYTLASGRLRGAGLHAVPNLAQLRLGYLLGGERKLDRPPHIFHILHAMALIYLAYVIARSALEDFSAAGASAGVCLEADSADPDRFHRPGAAGTSRENSFALT